MSIKSIFGFSSRDKPKDTVGNGVSFMFGRTTSGKPVNERTAMQTTAVYSCVRILAEAVASLPLHVYVYKEGGGKEMVTDHPLYTLLHDEPNPEMTSFVFRETLMSHLLIWGNAYAQIIRDGAGRVIGLYPLLPNRMDVERDEKGRLYYVYSRDTDENPNFRGSGDFILKEDEVLHAGVYADEGITGTSTNKRDEFNRLMKDCDAGKIDLVLVKSVSRFARDTVDTLQATRHLKSLGIDVYFERENVHSMSSEGELLLTLLASFAQAEAESISQNEKWSVQKHFEKGEPNTGILCFGYDWVPETKSLVINEEEGKWVKYIYEQYLGGATLKGLCLDLQEKGVRGKRGNPIQRSTLRRILSTETYVGDLLLQRYFSPSIHKPKLNEGEVDQVLVTDAHEPLVSREDFAKVQERLNHRAKTADNFGYEKSFFAGFVKCGKCGYACNHVVYHKQTLDKAFIDCNKRKTNECDLLPIRELKLKAIMEELAGCRENVERITLFDGHIDFLLKDGTVKRHIREFTPLGKKSTPFSGKLFCGYCGSSIVRCGSSKRRKCWMCSIKKTSKESCEHELMSDGELYGAARNILGTDENLDMQIYTQIEKTVSYNDRIEFYMKEGGKRVWQRR